MVPRSWNSYESDAAPASVADHGVGVAAAGLPPRSMVDLEVTGRSTVRIRTTVLAMPQHGGNGYLVSMLGNSSSWVRNARAKIPASQRAPVLKEYVRIAQSGRRHFPVAPGAPLSEFDTIADRYPVFRIDPR